MDGEISCSLLYLSNLERWIALFFLAASQCLCISADLLLGIWPLHAFRSWLFGLESPLAALFASSSTRSFSTMPTCPGVHLSVTSIPKCQSFTTSTCS